MGRKGSNSPRKGVQVHGGLEYRQRFFMAALLRRNHFISISLGGIFFKQRTQLFFQ